MAKQKEVIKPTIYEFNVKKLTDKTIKKGENRTEGQKFYLKLYDSLWNYIFMDYKRKDNFVRIIITEDDGVDRCFYLTVSELYIHLIFWRLHVTYAGLLKREVKIDRDDFYNLSTYNKSLVSKILETNMDKFIDDAQERPDGIDELSYFTSFIVDDLEEFQSAYCGIASNTISLYEIKELAKRSPVFNTCINTELDDKKSIKEIEQQLKKGERMVIDAILKDGKSSLYQYIKASRISSDQFTQMFYAVGPRTDVDKTILPAIMKGNFLKGYSCPSDAYMDAITGRDAQILKHISVRDSGYLSRKINLSNLNTAINYDVKDCGTKHTIPYNVALDDNLKSVDLKYMVNEDGSLHLIRYKNDKHLIGKTVQLRSHVACALNDNKVCMTCFGEKAKRLVGTLIGALPAIKFANTISKRLMRAKHFTTTNSVEIKSEYIDKYFNVESNKMYFKNEMRNKDVYIVIDREYVEEIANGVTDIEDECVDSSMPLESFIIQDGDERFSIECEGLFLVLTDEILEDSKKFIMEYDNDEALIPINKIDKDTPIFSMVIVTEEVSRYLKQIKKLIDSVKTKSYTSPALLIEDIGNVMIEMGIGGLSLINIETLVYQLVRNPEKLYERPDFSKSTPDICIIPLSAAIGKSDIRTAFSFEKYKQQITDPDSFEKTSSGIFDPLFKIERPKYLTKVDSKIISLVAMNT